MRKVISFALCLIIVIAEGAACEEGGGNAKTDPAASVSQPTPPATPPATPTPETAPPATPTTAPPSTAAPTSNETGTTLSGDGFELLDGIIAAAQGRHDIFPYCMTEDIIERENAPDYLGLTLPQISDYLSGAWLSNAIIMGGGAYQTAMVKLKREADAAEVASLMAANFNANRWICEFPRVCETVVIGDYVFLIASSEEVSSAIKEELSLRSGIPLDKLNVNRFYTHEAGAESGGGDGPLFLG